MSNDKTPMWMRCGPCGHRWIGLHTPMEMERVAQILKAIYCPMCGVGSKEIFATDAPEAEAKHG
jgi:rubredoxin